MVSVCLRADGLETVELDDPAAGYVVLGVDVGAPQAREVVTPRPMASGTVDRTRYAGSRAVSLNLAFVEEPDTRQVLLDRVAPFLRPGQMSELVLAKDPAAAPRVLKVRAVDWSAPWQRPSHLPVTLSFVTAGTPWFLSEEWRELRLVPEGSEPGRTYNEVQTAAAEAVDLPGVAGSFATAPYSMAWDTFGAQLAVEFEIDPDDETPAADQVVVARHVGLSDPLWKVTVTTAGALELSWQDSVSGTERTAATAAAAVAAGRAAYRIVLVPDNGAAEAEVRFYSATSLDGPWTIIGAAVTSAGAGVLAASTAGLWVSGSDSGTVDPFAGLVYGVRLRDDTDSVLAGWVIDDLQAGVTAWMGEGGEEWTVAGTALVTGGSSTVIPDLQAGVELTGVAGSYVSTPDAAALDITGDIDIRVDLTLDDWAPGTGNARLLLTKFSTNAGYWFYLYSGGELGLSWGDSTAIRNATAGTATSGTGRRAVRVTLDVNNGAGGCTARFYSASTIDGTWSQIGADLVLAGATSIAAGTSDLILGTNTGDTAVGWTRVDGRYHGLEIRDGIDGTPVASWRGVDLTDGATSFTDDTSLLWTLAANASIVNGTVTTIDEMGRGYDRVYPYAEPALLPAFNEGDVPVDWQATIYGPLTGITLINTTTGDQISLPDLDIPAGQNVVIDSETRTVLADSDPDASRFSYIDFVASTWFRLEPGLNMFRAVSPSFSAPAQTWIRWRDAYLT